MSGGQWAMGSGQWAVSGGSWEVANETFGGWTGGTPILLTREGCERRTKLVVFIP